MKRRSFLRNASVLSLPLMLGGSKLAALAQPRLAAAVNDDDRILVLLQLNGGNDGLNTLIPLDQYSGLAATRSNLLIPESSVLAVSDTAGFHPAMTGVRELYDAGKVSVIQGVGYAGQNRSHFRSTDIWNTGSASDTVETQGWLGRHLDVRFPGYPNAYPTVDNPDPFAIVMGTAVSETCQGSAANFSIALNDIDNVGQLPNFGGTENDGTPYGDELAWLRQTIEQSNQYAAGIQDAAGAGSNLATYPEDNELAARLRDVARLISGGLTTKIYIVELGGFDTHANQTVENDPTAGEHAVLLRTLSDAVAAFQADLAALGLEERVLGMTYSEFGRRIRSNASQGTDHGDAAPLFLFGGCVSGGITGENPEIDPAVGIDEGVPYQYDFRNVYGSVLMDWFGVEDATVRNLLLDEFEYVPVLAACRTTSATDFSPLRSAALTVAPNPSRGQFTVGFRSDAERVRVVLFDGMGRQVRTLTDRTLAAGDHRLTVNTSGLPAGAYFVHLTMAGGVRATRRVVVE